MKAAASVVAKRVFRQQTNMLPRLVWLLDSCCVKNPVTLPGGASRRPDAQYAEQFADSLGAQGARRVSWSLSKERPTTSSQCSAEGVRQSEQGGRKACRGAGTAFVTTAYR